MADAPADGPLLDPQALATSGAQRRAALQKGATAEPELPFIRFELGGERYAVPLLAVSKIERVPTVVPVPRTPAFVRGIASLRGETVCVVDLASILGTVSSAAKPLGLLVLAEGARKVGVLSDILPDYFRAKATAFSPPPTGRASEGVIVHALDRDEGAVAVLDVRKLLDLLARRLDV